MAGRYLLFDHGGVLQDTVMDAEDQDLILTLHEWGGCEVLKDGKLVLVYIDRLCKEYGYKVAFHSGNSLDTQLDTFELIVKAANELNLPVPHIAALPVLDSTKFGLTRPQKPEISKRPLYPGEEQTIISGYGESVSEEREYRTWKNEIASGIGKQDVRIALEAVLSDIDKSQSHVFDDGEPNCAIAKLDGYCSHWINFNGTTLQKALESILLQCETQSVQTSNIPDKSETTDQSVAPTLENE